MIPLKYNSIFIFDKDNVIPILQRYDFEYIHANESLFVFIRL